MANRTKLTAKKKTAVLNLITDYGGNITKACRELNLARQTVYDHIHRDPKFAEQVKSAVDKGADVLISEATRRAIDGVESDVFQNGRLVGTQTKYSDNLLMFLIKARRPEFKDKFEITNIDGKPLAPCVVHLPDNERQSVNDDNEQDEQQRVA